MDAETLLRRVDPALGAEIPGPSSAEALRIRDHALSVRPSPTSDRTARARLTVGTSLSAVCAAAATVILLFVLLPGSDGTSKASAALTRLAEQAATVPTALGPGQYAYTEIEESPTMVSVGNATPGGTAFTEYFTGTVQTWVAADGSGRRVITMDPTPRFYTAADRALWVAAGSPPAAVPPGQLTTVQTFGPKTASEVNGPIPLYNVAGLPTDPTALRTILSNENPGDQSLGTLPAGIKSLDFASSCTTAACTLFERTVALLQGPDIGATPPLRQALFDVLAGVPGVKDLGTRTDEAGQSGTDFSLVQYEPARTETVICTNAPGVAANSHDSITTTTSTTTYSVVIDPQTTDLLSSEVTSSPLVRVMPAGPPCGAGSGSHELERQEFGPQWNEVVNAGVTASDTATPALNTSG